LKVSQLDFGTRGTLSLSSRGKKSFETMGEKRITNQEEHLRPKRSERKRGGRRGERPGILDRKVKRPEAQESLRLMKRGRRREAKRISFNDIGGGKKGAERKEYYGEKKR